MWCAATRKLPQLPSLPLSVTGALVCPVYTVRDLGVFIDNDLGAAIHVQRTASRCFAALRHLRHLRRYATDDCFRSLGGVARALQTRLRQLRPGRGSCLSTAAPPVIITFIVHMNIT